jgi:virginiamycin B lyase
MKTRVPMYAFAMGDTFVPSGPLVVPCGSGPISIAYGFDSVWVGCTNTGQVERFGMDGVKVASIPLTSPQGFCVGAGSFWATSLLNNTLSRIDPSTNAIAATIPVGLRPSDCCFDGTHIWTSNFNGGTVSKVDPSTNSVVATLPVAANPSYRMAFDGKKLWVGDWSGAKVVGVDVVTHALTTINGISQPWGMFFDGTHLLVSSYATSKLHVISPSAGAVQFVASLANGGGPHDVIGFGGEIWVALSSLNQIHCLDKFSYSTVRLINTGSDPAGLCFDGSSIWLTNALGNSVARYQVRERW